MMRAAFIAILASACGSKQAAPTGTEPPPKLGTIDNTCTEDEDCALVEGCCGCSAGGRRTAIRADQVASHDQAKQAECGDQMCPQVISDDPSCNAEASCQNGRCAVMPHLGTGSATIPPAKTE